MCCCQNASLLVEAYRVGGERLFEMVWDRQVAPLLEATKDDKGHCHDEHGHYVPCPGRAPQSHVVRVGRQHNHAVWANQHGHKFLTKHVFNSRKLDTTEKAELIGASLLGHFHVGRTNTGQSKNAFDAANGRWPDGTLELVDAKTSKDARGLKFKKDSRENQFESWRRGEDQEPGKTRVAQLAFILFLASPCRAQCLFTTPDTPSIRQTRNNRFSLVPWRRWTTCETKRSTVKSSRRCGRR